MEGRLVFVARLIEGEAMIVADATRDGEMAVLRVSAWRSDPGAERRSKRQDLTVSELCELYLSQDELERLGDALAEAEAAGENPKALAIIRLLALTGARRGEIINLAWNEVDFDKGMLRLRDSKTGQRIIPVGKSALAILASQPRTSDSGLVFPADKLGRRGAARTHFQGIDAIWYRVRAKAELPDVRLHDLRHTAASVAVANGASLPMIARILGHADTKTTQRYAHLSDAPVRHVVEELAEQVAAAMRGRASTT